MQSVVGVFASQADACRALERLVGASIARDRVSLLLPGTPEGEVARRVPVDEGEQPGMGAAIGGVVGGAVGLTAAAIVLPGVGPIVVAGLLAAGLAGTASGAAAGDFLEDWLAGGLPRDELPVYAEALRRGKSLTVAAVSSDAEAERTREALRAAGAESVDPARADWRIGLEAGPGSRRPQ